MRPRWCSRTDASPIASSMRARASWRIICARSASAPRWWWGFAWSARRRCSSRSSASSRPAAPICRSIPDYPPERLAFMLDDAGAPVLLTHSALLDRLPTASRAASYGSMPTGPPSRRSPPPLLPSHSMRTTPSMSPTPRDPRERRKASSVTHRNVVRLVKSANYVELTPDDVFLQFAPLSFDASTFEIWGALLNGARLVIYPDGAFRAPTTQARSSRRPGSACCG